MDRPEIYDQSQGRSYDILWGWRETLFATSALVSDILGQTTTVVSGLAATASGPTSLVINLAAGNIYQLANLDGTAYGSLTADLRQVLQQGFAAAQTLALTTTGLSSGQSRWALIEATFTQTDDIPGDDPNGGLLAFLNTSNPSGPPWSGPANAGTTLPTRRKSVCTLSVIYGTAASTGTEVPPAASAGNVGLYLIDLAFGQTTVAQNQILTAGPSVGAGVPSNYPVAPFLAGLLNSHHNGKAGQAPKVNLATETQGILPSTSVSGLLPGVVGQARNAKMSVAAAAATATFNADEIVVETALGGSGYRLATYSQSINLGTTGAGGMDTGVAPTSGYVALYAIYNPTTATASILAVDATSAVAPQIYGGANMPAGYTASALISAWPTNASKQFAVAYQQDRTINIANTTVLSSGTPQASPTALSITSTVPPNARGASGNNQISSSATATLTMVVFATSAGSGQQGLNSTQSAGGFVSIGFRNLPLSVAQTLYYTAATTAGTPTYTISITSYDF